MQNSQSLVIERPGETTETLLAQTRIAVAEGLTPYLQDIDVRGVYPKEFMHQLGAIGGYAQATPETLGGAGQGIKGTIQMMEIVASQCLSTGFCTWCQTVCGWYIQNGESDYLKQQILPRIISGEILAGTGLSNPMKHFAGIEKIRIKARRTAGGYILNGGIPWVSNVGVDHYFAVVAALDEGEAESSYLMAVIPGDSPGLKLGFGGQFIALEGSSTYSCNFKEVFVPDEFVLAHPCQDYVARVRPGFILSQTGFGLGLVSSCVELMKHTNLAKGHVNCFLDDQAEDIETDLMAARAKIYALADEVGCGEDKLRAGIMAEVSEARIITSELSLRASQAAMLHAGANGYRLHCTFERKLRESYFVAIVTPALKHLKKLLYEIKCED